MSTKRVILTASTNTSTTTSVNFNVFYENGDPVTALQTNKTLLIEHVSGFVSPASVKVSVDGINTLFVFPSGGGTAGTTANGSQYLFALPEGQVPVLTVSTTVASDVTVVMSGYIRST